VQVLDQADEPLLFRLSTRGVPRRRDPRPAHTGNYGPHGGVDLGSLALNRAKTCLAVWAGAGLERVSTSNLLAATS
jgi:hypothetical protein